ncbi:MAG: cysteine desulfurase family protein [Pseudanabaenaceae cyanobacterium SKYGB_i_bin29]|nr:cysteine desulfurase [Pseudanabaenaceae cyanobacterium SKYG29]MDW8420634.1 cysteine desulfurase family protein [Pseudanabaenaceae cyanobacterium SKYGB_i_bin29]
MGIYLDYSATTPTRREVRELMVEIMTHHWGNPSSIHSWGTRSAMVVERARMQVAELIGAQGDEIVFTGSGTAANHLAIFGVTRQYRTPRHLIISAVEHSAVAAPVAWLEAQGWSVTRLTVDRYGKVDSEALQEAIREETVLVSVIYAHNEVGTIQPIKDLGQICRACGVIFHTDAVQAIGRIPIDVKELPVDLLSLSAHKFYGPQGVGALYIRSGLDLQPYLFGGGQEWGLYSGTHAVAAIGGMGLAAQLIQEEMATEIKRLLSLQQKLKLALDNVGELIFTGEERERLPHHLSYCHPTLGGREIVRKLDQLGIAISAGSACSSGKIIPSPTLLAMGFSQQEALGGFRISLGKYTTPEEIDRFLLAVQEIF